MPAFSAPPLVNTHASMGSTVIVDYSLLVTLHLNPRTVESNPKNPWTCLGSANVCVVSVPNGANYLDIYHIWRSNATAGGSGAVTRPKVRVFGEIPVVKGLDYVADPAKNMATLYDPLANGTHNWIPLPNRVSGNNTYEITVGPTGDEVEPMLYGANSAISTANSQAMSTPAGVLLKGVRRVLVAVSSGASFANTANVDANGSVLAGAFGYTLYS